MTFANVHRLMPPPPKGCDYCGRTDAPDYASKCRGCGAPKKSVEYGIGEWIDVTTTSSTVKNCIFVGGRKS